MPHPLLIPGAQFPLSAFPLSLFHRKSNVLRILEGLTQIGYYAPYLPRKINSSQLIVKVSAY